MQVHSIDSITPADMGAQLCAFVDNHRKLDYHTPDDVAFQVAQLAQALHEPNLVRHAPVPVPEEVVDVDASDVDGPEVEPTGGASPSSSTSSPSSIEEALAAGSIHDDDTSCGSSDVAITHVTPQPSEEEQKETPTKKRRRGLGLLGRDRKTKTGRSGKRSRDTEGKESPSSSKRKPKGDKKQKKTKKKKVAKSEKKKRKRTKGKE